MPVNILMPALSPTMEKGNLAKWLKKEGEKVKPGDVIAEIETDKATMEYEAIDEGTLAKIVVPEGTQDVPVNQLIAVLAEEGEDVKTAAAGAEERRTRSEARGLQSRQARRRRPHPRRRGLSHTAGGLQRARKRISRVPLRARKRWRRARPPGPRHMAPTGYSPRRWRAGWPRMPASTSRGSKAPARTAASSRAMSKRPNRARDLPPRLPPRSAAAAPLAVQIPADDKIRALFEPGSYEVVPHDNIRKVIARRLLEAKLTIPHFYLTVDCNIDKLLAAREEINAAAGKDKEGKPAYKTLGQRFRHQGARACASARTGCQRDLDRRRHAPAQALRHRRCGVHTRRTDHPGHPQGRAEIAFRHLQ